MTNTRFNKLWERCERNGMVNFAERGEQYTLSVHRCWTGNEYVLEKFNGHYLSTVIVHWSKAQFERLLAF